MIVDMEILSDKGKEAIQVEEIPGGGNTVVGKGMSLGEFMARRLQKKDSPETPPATSS